MAQRDQIVMVRRQNPKRATLPNGRTFLARYRRATHTELPANVHLKRPYRQQLQEVKGDVSDKAGEVLKVHLKKLSVLLKKSVKTKL